MAELNRLPDKFRRARLDLEVLKAPLGGRSARGQEDIVQLDITPAGRSSQRFRLYGGARDNRVEVLGADAAHRQLVLFVDEPRRRFEIWQSKRSALAKGARVVRETATLRAIEQFTEGRKRHFLCGMDEQHLFIAELPCGVSSTHAAREALRAPEVPTSLMLRGQRVLRQGEWFFLPLLPRERELAEQLVTKRLVQREVGIAQAALARRAGRPHVASEVVVVPQSYSGVFPLVFVRGDVRHPDHQTLSLREFYRTVPNRERFAQAEGVFWID